MKHEDEKNTRNLKAEISKNTSTYAGYLGEEEKHICMVLLRGARE